MWHLASCFSFLYPLLLTVIACTITEAQIQGEGTGEVITQ